MSRKKILVALTLSERDLKCVHYALSLAERLRGQVYILQAGYEDAYENQVSAWREEALQDLINSARKAGVSISHHITRRELAEEVSGLIREEGIDLLVLGTGERISDRLLLQLQPLVKAQIIQVKEKEPVKDLRSGEICR